MTKREVVNLRAGDSVVLEVPVSEGFVPLVTRIVKEVQRGRRPGMVQVAFACGHTRSFGMSESVRIATKE